MNKPEFIPKRYELGNGAKMGVFGADALHIMPISPSKEVDFLHILIYKAFDRFLVSFLKGLTFAYREVIIQSRVI
jgi:hypothetical protein